MANCPKYLRPVIYKEHINSLSADDEDGAVVGDNVVGYDDDADGEVVVDGRTRERCM